MDFDGTLAPLVSHPSLSKMDLDSEVALRSIVNNPNIYVAIISGRSADDARKIAKFDDITYAGNHGLEINFKNKARYDHQLDAQTRENFSKMVEELETTVSLINNPYITLNGETIKLIIFIILVQSKWRLG